MILEEGSLATQVIADWLDIRGCLTLNLSAFKGVNTRHLNLQYNKIKRMKKEFFKGLVRISALTMTQNEIEVIETNSFNDNELCFRSKYSSIR